MASKETAAFPAVFQPLLGPIDDAAESLLVGRLQDVVASERDAQEAFFVPDPARTRKKHLDYLETRGASRKRLLVHRSPLMPTGLLLFCLEYASKEGEGAGGVFNQVRERFRDLAAPPLPDLLKSMYDLRNTFIAHVKEELTDSATAEEALQGWIKLLRLLHAAKAEFASV